METTENSIKVLVDLPDSFHKRIKIESVLKDKKIQEVIIDRLRRDLDKYPVDNISNMTA